MIYKFDEFEVKDTLREIRLGGSLLNVEPKVYDLIVYFMEHAHQAISKDELQDAIWPAVEVSETAVTRAIMKARKVLTDPDQPQTYIQTIHGHGYKFIANLTVEQPGDNGLSVVSSEHRKSRVPGLLGLLLLCSFVAVGFIYLSQLGQQNERRQLLVLPVENQLADEQHAWFSLGLMALASKVIEASLDVWIVPEQDSLRARDLLSGESLPVSAATIDQLRDKLKVDYVVVSRISATADEQFLLEYEVHHPKGVFSDARLTGLNPTDLAERMAKQISQLMPGRVARQQQTVISGDPFTNELYSRGKAFQIQGDVDQAEQYFALAMAQDPGLLAPKYELAVVKRKQNKLTEAKQELEDLLANLSAYPHSHLERIQLLNSLGVTHLRMLEHDTAMNYYLQAYELAKQHQQHRYLATIANNIAIVYRRQQHTEEARKWAVESLAIIKQHDLPLEPGVTYLLGQIERDSGNFNQAVTLFTEALEGFMQEGNRRYASTVLSATADLLKRKGRYHKALNILADVMTQKAQLNDVLGQTDARLYTIEIHQAMGDLVTARKLLGEFKSFIAEHQITTRDVDYLKAEIAQDYLEEHYQVVLQKINGQAAGISSKNLDMLALKSRQLLGETEVIKTWLAENKHLKSGENTMMRMYWLDFENHYMESQSDLEALIASYTDRLALSRLMGNDALSAQLLLKTGYQYLNSGQLSAAESVLNEIKSLDLDWWQIKFYEALLAHALGDHPAALTAATTARQAAGTAWSDRYEAVYHSVQNGLPEDQHMPKLLF
jgi:DNA-binding winged helix-turn-helix (wHTH) protein/Tfp pilus assembly protein PilF